MKTVEQFLFIAKGYSPHDGCTDSEAIWTAKQYSDQEKQALKDRLTKKIEASKLSGLSKATVYALITQL